MADPASIIDQLAFLKWAGGGIATGLTVAIVHLYRRETACRGELAKYRLAFMRLLDFVSGMTDSNRAVLRRPTVEELFDPNFNINSLFQTAPQERRRQIRATNASKKLVQKDTHIP